MLLQLIIRRQHDSGFIVVLFSLVDDSLVLESLDRIWVVRILTGKYVARYLTTLVAFAR